MSIVYVGIVCLDPQIRSFYAISRGLIKNYDDHRVRDEPYPSEITTMLFWFWFQAHTDTQTHTP